MNDELYRQARDAMDAPRCLYEKALQFGYFSCEYAQRILLGEREAQHCQNPLAYANCEEFFALSLSKSGFALGTVSLPTHLTFNKAMQVQIGGLQGAMDLCDKLDKTSDDLTERDVAACFTRIKQHSIDFEALDFSDIVPRIQQFSLRKRTTRG